MSLNISAYHLSKIIGSYNNFHEIQEDEFDFQIEPLPLTEYATVALASQICDRYFPNIIKRLQQNDKLPQIGNTSRDHVGRKTIANEIRKEISETLSVDLNYLPEIIKTKIRTKALELIGVLYDWITFVMGYLRLDVIYLDKIYWTPTGIIDVEKIFTLSWINIPVDEVTCNGWFTEKFSRLHYLACFFAQEQFISDFQVEIIREIKDIFPWFNVNENSNIVFRIISIVIFCYDASVQNRDLASITADEVNERNLSAVTMLNICRSRNFDKAYVYFYSFLNASEELSLIEIASQTYFEEDSDSETSEDVSLTDLGPITYFEHTNSEIFYNEVLAYRIESRFQIKIFLLKKMNSFQKYNLIQEDLHFLFLNFLQKGYFLKYCTSLLDTFLIHYVKSRGKEFHRYVALLKSVISIIGYNVIDVKLDYFIYVELLEIFMKILPKNMKYEVITHREGEWEKNIIKRIYDQFCVPVMKVIINDYDLQAQKIKMINKGRKKFQLLIENKEYEDLEKFRIEILTSKADEDAFDQIFFNELLKWWISDGRFDFVDNYLTWKYGDEADIFKLNMYPLWCSFISKNYTDVTELLMWCFGKQEIPSLKNCQLDHEILSLKLFCRELIYNIWFRSDIVFKDTFPAANLSNQILAAVLVSQKEIENFKKNYLVKDDSCVRFFCRNEAKKEIKDEKNYLQFVGIDEFFNFCAISPNAISAIKRSIADNELDWTIEYGVSEHFYKIVVPLLDWVNGKEADNCEIRIKNFC